MVSLHVRPLGGFCILSNSHGIGRDWEMADDKPDKQPVLSDALSRPLSLPLSCIPYLTPLSGRFPTDHYKMEDICKQTLSLVYHGLPSSSVFPERTI